MNGNAILFLVVMLGCAAPLAAQRRARTEARSRTDESQQTAPSRQTDASIDSADIAITATVTAKELKFEVVPNPTVEFPRKA